jgi:hypothetical protein
LAAVPKLVLDHLIAQIGVTHTDVCVMQALGGRN